MSEEKKIISRYVYPFLMENPREMKKHLSKESSFWEKTECEIRLLSSPVREQFSKENGNIQIYKITDVGYKECVSDDRGKEFVLKIKNGSGEYYQSIFMIDDISLWVFASGLAFFVLEISFPSEYDICDLANFSAGFSRLKTGLVFSKGIIEYNGGKKVLDFCRLFEKLTAHLWLKSLENSFDEIKPSYHTIYTDNEEKDYKSYCNDLGALCKNVISIGFSEGKNEKISHIDIEQFDGVHWLGSVSSIVLYCWKQKNAEYNLSKKTYENAQKDYFHLYMMAIHAKTFVLFCNAEIIRLRDRTYELSKIKDKLISFNGFFLLEYVSEHDNVQFFYDELMKQLSVKRLTADIKDSISAIENREDDIKERWLGPLKTFIFFFGLTGSINGVFTLLNNLGSWEKYSLQEHIILVLVPIIIALVLVDGFFFRKKR